jgi:DNA invertase Pin-like site-specific DNA recombinase
MLIPENEAFFCAWRANSAGKSAGVAATRRAGIPPASAVGRIRMRRASGRTSTSTRREIAIFHIFGALAEFERDIIRERTQAGLQAARARGRKGGRPKSLTGKKTAMAQALYKGSHPDLSVNIR